MNGLITILAGVDTRIQLEDKNAGIIFLEINLTAEQLVRALGRQGNIPCKFTVRGLDKVGKQEEVKVLELPIPETTNDFEEIKEIFDNHLINSEWVSDNYFGSRSSFFYKDGQRYARTHIRRWLKND